MKIHCCFCYFKIRMLWK